MNRVTFKSELKERMVRGICKRKRKEKQAKTPKKQALNPKYAAPFQSLYDY